MLTFSCKSAVDLDDAMRHLVASFRRLRQRQAWKKLVIGGAWILELTHSPRGWHPHIHALVYGYYYPWAQLRDQWMAVSGGSAVFITALPHSTTNAVDYLTKYLTKQNLPNDKLLEAESFLRDFRLVQCFGGWTQLPPLSKEAGRCPFCSSTNLVKLPHLYDLTISQWRHQRTLQRPPPSTN